MNTNDNDTIPANNSIVEVFKLQRVDDPFGLTPKFSRRGTSGLLVVNTKIVDGQHFWQCDFCGEWFKTGLEGREEVLFEGGPNVLKAKCFDCAGVDVSKFTKRGGK